MAQPPKCKEGYWTYGDINALLCIIKGEELAVMNMVSLDYPDIQSLRTMALEYGDFGEANKEIAQATGARNYNLKLKDILYSMKAVLNDEGTKMNISGIGNKMEVWEWISPEKVKELAEDRDDAEAPRLIIQ